MIEFMTQATIISDTPLLCNRWTRRRARLQQNGLAVQAAIKQTDSGRSDGRTDTRINTACIQITTTILRLLIPGEARLGRTPTGVAQSEITHVRVLSWPLPLLTSLYFCRSRKYCHEILSRSFTKASEAEIFTRVRRRNYWEWINVVLQQ